MRSRSLLFRVLAVSWFLGCVSALFAEESKGIFLFNPDNPGVSEWKDSWGDVPAGAGAKVVGKKMVVTGTFNTQSYGCVYRPFEVDLDKTPFLEIEVEQCSHHWYILLRGEQLPNGYAKVLPDTDQTGPVQIDLRLALGLAGKQKFKEVQLGVSTEESGGNKGHTLTIQKMLLSAAPQGGGESLELFGPKNPRLSGWKNVNDDRSPSGADILPSTDSVTLRGNRPGQSFGMIYRQVNVDLTKFSVFKFAVESVSHHWYIIMTHPELNKGFVRIQPDCNLTGVFYYDLADITGLKGLKDFRLQIGVSTNEQKPSVLGETMTFKEISFLSPAQLPPSVKVLKKKDLKFQQKIQAAVPKVYKRIEPPSAMEVLPAKEEPVFPAEASQGSHGKKSDLLEQLGQELDRAFAREWNFDGQPKGSVPVQFKETDKQLLVQNRFYKIAFSKQNGAVLSLGLARSTVPVIVGTLDSALWKIDTLDKVIWESARHAAGSGTHPFSWRWEEQGRALDLDYELKKEGLRVRVSFEFDDSEIIQAKATLENRSDKIILSLQLPHGLLYKTSDLDQVILPRLIGVAFKPGFFRAGKRWTDHYPPAFSDYVWIGGPQGNLSVYLVQPKGAFQPASLEIGPGKEGGTEGFYTHRMPIFLKKSQTWESPRIRMTLGKSPYASIRDYAVQNAIEQFPSMADKLKGDLLDRVFRSLFIKVDQSVNVDITSVIEFLKDLPPLSILHYTTFWPGGFDKNYPDYLPPDPDYGTLDDLKALIGRARGRGMLAMPYTNPTWWNDGPTMRRLKPEEIGVRQADGTLLQEKYNGNPGMVVNPNHPQVIERNQETVREFTQVLPMDLLFQDQLGARRWIYQYNGNAPGPSSFTSGLIEEAARGSRKVLLMTEGGFDRLLPYEIGFCGMTSLSYPNYKEYDDLWGKGNWEVYPISLFLAHHKVIFYQHNLSDDVVSDTDAKLGWNLAYGFGLMMKRTYIRQNLEKKWIRLCDLLQKNFVSKILGQEMKGYLKMGQDATWSRFGDFDVYSNHSGQEELSIGDDALAPNGFLARRRRDSSSEGLLAGYLTRLNGEPLEDRHYLVIQSAARKIRVIQGDPKTTFLTLLRPPDWTLNTAIRGYEVKDDQETPAALAVTRDRMTFLYRADREPDSYRIVYDPPPSGLEASLDPVSETLSSPQTLSVRLRLKNTGSKALRDIRARVGVWKVLSHSGTPEWGELPEKGPEPWTIRELEPGREWSASFRVPVAASAFFDGRLLWLRARLDFQGASPKEKLTLERRLDLAR